MSRFFPDEFLFGCATSAYQIEGGIENDWALWERAGRLEDQSARCGAATDHWNRWEDDFALLKALGAGAYRFSVEWARVEPEPGRFDQAAIDQYIRMVDALREANVEPFVTLLHFTHPTWFAERCAWHVAGGDGPSRFGAFAARMARAFGDRVRHWTVINEPSVWLAAAYFKGVIPPGYASLRKLMAAAAGLVRAHAEAHASIRAAHANARIGVAKHFMHFTPSRRSHPLDRLAARYATHHFNHAIVDALMSGVLRFGFLPGIRVVTDIPQAAGTLDFLGVNFYSRLYVEARPRLGPSALEVFYEDRHGRGVSDLGWEIYPEGMTEALLEMNRYGLPLYVTENGIDDRDDARRARFIHSHLKAVLDAMDQGADVRGYLHWSLLDNFEWLEAYLPRFGLYRVDYDSMARTLTNGGAFFRDVIRTRSLAPEAPAGSVTPGTGRVPAG